MYTLWDYYTYLYIFKVLLAPSVSVSELTKGANNRTRTLHGPGTPLLTVTYLYKTNRCDIENDFQIHSFLS